MMNKRILKGAGATAIAALSLSGLLVLSACEERPYPAAAKSYNEPPAAPPPAQLAGAPATQPSYAPPPPPVAYAPPPPPAPVYTQPYRGYDAPAIVAMAPIPNPGEPGSEGYYNGYRVRGHHGGYAPAPAYNDGYAAPAPRHPHPTYAPKPTPPAYVPPVKTYAAKPPVPPKPTPPAYTPPKPVTPPVKTYAAKPPVPPKPTPPAYTPPKKPDTYAQKGAAVGAAAGAAVGAVAKVAKPDAKAVADAAKTTYADKKAAPAGATPADKLAAKAGAAGAALVAGAKVAAKDTAATAKTATADAKAAYNANKPGAAPAPAAKPAAPAPAPAANTADRSTRLAALQSALTDAVSKGAVLTAPDRFTANQPADVTLTVPAAFADTLRNEAQKNGLSDAAASVNMTAVLSGDGFSVTPDETQSQPLTVGQPTEFRWTVTAQPGAKGPLHAEVGADLLGGGSDTLALGSVQKAAGLGVKLTPRVVGAVILVLIFVLVVAWLARGRGPTRSASARRASRAARGARPLDMGAGGSSEGAAH